MSDESDAGERSGAGELAAGALAAVAVTFTLLLSVVDVVLTPVANAYNRTLGRFYGEMSGLQLVLLVVGLLGIVTLPFVLEIVFGVENQNIHGTFILAAVWAIFAMSWDIQSGYTGYISFGHSVLSGAAAYALGMMLWHTEILSIVQGLPGAAAFNTIPIVPQAGTVVTFVLAVLAALAVGMLIALPTLRLEGPYFSLITFVAVLLFTRLVPAFSDWTGGDQQGINLDVHGGLEFVLFELNPDLQSFNYLIALIPLLLIAFALVTISRSNVGLILMAIRENESAVSAAGINPTKFKLWSFVVSSIPMGIGGVLLAHYMRLVSMQELVITDNSIEMIAIAVVGGISSIVGPLFAAFGFIFLERHLLEWALEYVPYVHSEEKFLFLWLLVILVLIFARNGLFRLVWHAAGAIGGGSE